MNIPNLKERARKITNIIKEKLNKESTKREVLYDSVSWDFQAENTYSIGGDRPNALHIARSHGCNIEFIDMQIGGRIINQMSPSHLERYGIKRDGTLTSAILTGKDDEQFNKAKRDIYILFGGELAQDIPLQFYKRGRYLSFIQ